ncbi:MAG: histidine--tRNA ligase [Candidatus Bathyarchaeia archaeon]|jgi:histidyl-tRNA synthetase
MAEFKTVRGMRDFLPEEARLLRHVEGRAREVARLYRYREIVTPVVESYELLSAKAGEEVKSRMFLFKDLGGRDVALRPEFTASVARLVATTLRNEPRPFRLFSVGSIYRYDEPQRGRYREFWQTNYELMGSSRPEADAEILLLTNSLMQTAGLKKFAFKVGHIGVLRGILTQEKLVDKVQSAVMQLMDKKQYEDAFRLVESAGVSETCILTLQKLVELKGNNVLDVVDRVAELVGDYEKSVEASRNLGEILDLVLKSRCDVDMTVDAGFARGLEYYTGMILEVYVPDLDIALGGGGRYDRLIELFGGDPTPAVGVAHGVDRLMLALQEQKAAQRTLRETEEERAVLVVPIKEELRGEALRVSQMLRNAGVSVELEVMGRKMAKALEDADRRKMSYAVIIGERELKEGAVVVRNLAKRVQSTVKIEDVLEAVKS